MSEARQQALRDRYAGRALLVAASAGSDSTALAHLLVAAGARIRLAHVDHGLRDDTDRDWELIRALGDRWGVPTLRLGVDPEAFERGDGGVEAIARRERYRLLAEARVSDEVIVTGHTADDRLETVMIRALQGTGVRGIAGPLDHREIAGAPVERPLLDWWRDELTALLVAAELPWREDPTNAELGFLRNRVRHGPARALQALADPVVLARTLAQWQEDAAVFERWSRQRLGEVERARLPGVVILDRVQVRAMDDAERRAVLREALHQIEAPRQRRGILARWAAAICEPGARALSGHRVTLEVGREVRLCRADVSVRSTPIALDDRWVDVDTWRVRRSQEPGGEAWVFDRASLDDPLAVRPVTRLDRMIPFGRSREVGVWELLKRDGFSAEERARAWVVVDAADRILGVVGGRRSALAPVDDGSLDPHWIHMSRATD